MGCKRQGGRSRNPAMCGDIAVLLIPMPLRRRFGKSRRVVFGGASGRKKHPPFFGRSQAVRDIGHSLDLAFLTSVNILNLLTFCHRHDPITPLRWSGVAIMLVGVIWA